MVVTLIICSKSKQGKWEGCGVLLSLCNEEKFWRFRITSVRNLSSVIPYASHAHSWGAVSLDLVYLNQLISLYEMHSKMKLRSTVKNATENRPHNRCLLLKMICPRLCRSVHFTNREMAACSPARYRSSHCSTWLTHTTSLDMNVSSSKTIKNVTCEHSGSGSTWNMSFSEKSITSRIHSKQQFQKRNRFTLSYSEG
jgi:hypothetical protein